MKTKLINEMCGLLLVLCVITAASAREQLKRQDGLNKVSGTPTKTYLNINSISSVFWNNGFADIEDTSGLFTPSGGKGGFVFPKGSHKITIFESGLLWGARIGGQIHVGGSTYRTGLQGGKVVPSALQKGQDLPNNRIYRVRPDYKTGDLSSEIADEGNTADEVKAQYALDWNEWPASDGAPFQDKNDNGVYDPVVDIAGVKGAGQTIWFVCNDLDSSKTISLYGSTPMGIEMQVTAWAYSQPFPLDKMFFKSYLLINKSNTTFDSMYVAQWLDPDIGSGINDLAGCDTSLSLGYAYNATVVDTVYAPLPPPAAGATLLQGPIVPSPGKTAISRSRLISNSRNLPMTAFYWFGRGGPDHSDPQLGVYKGSLQWYNVFRGLVNVTGERYTDPTTGLPTSFMVSGDPVKRTGYIDGVLLPYGDRRVVLSSGPFTMAPGDTQEVVVAEVAAGAYSPVTYLEAVDLLKYYVAVVRTMTLDVKKEENVPAAFELYQNYPNPFNPTTTIQYQLPVASRVIIKICDILGQEVKTLADGEAKLGFNSVQWNSTDNRGNVVASGVYFYRMETSSLTDPKRSTVQVKKMLVLR